nr:immunoglobulin heavy chain junction region [Macaca mulatta]
CARMMGRIATGLNRFDVW